MMGMADGIGASGTSPDWARLTRFGALSISRPEKITTPHGPLHAEREKCLKHIDNHKKRVG